VWYTGTSVAWTEYMERAWIVVVEVTSKVAPEILFESMATPLVTMATPLVTMATPYDCTHEAIKYI